MAFEEFVIDGFRANRRRVKPEFAPQLNEDFANEELWLKRAITKIEVSIQTTSKENFPDLLPLLNGDKGGLHKSAVAVFPQPYRLQLAAHRRYQEPFWLPKDCAEDGNVAVILSFFLPSTSMMGGNAYRRPLTMQLHRHLRYLRREGFRMEAAAGS